MEDSSSSRKRLWLDRYFSYLEHRKPSDRLIITLLVWVVLISSIFAIFSLNTSYSESFPSPGGTFSEGVIGTPRFVNPVLAITRADQDLAALIYSGLLKLTPEGTLGTDLAADYSISEDGTVYSVTLRPDAVFHDGEPVLAEDILYTIALIQDAELKSPLRGSWNEVEVEAISERELTFTLEEAYAPFIENLTVGILPKHVWDNLATEELPFSLHNTEPVGAGPYRVKSVKRNLSGLIDAYTLESVTSETTKIDTIRLNFYQNEDALIDAMNRGEVVASASVPNNRIDELETDRYTILTEPLPRTFSVFINQNRSAALRDKAVREALSMAINREALIEATLSGYGIASQQPVPQSFLAATGSAPQATNTVELAAALLRDASWEQAEDGTWKKEIEEETVVLEISIATANTPLFEATATYLEEVWGELGVQVSVALFEQSDLVQAVIRPRDYQALLFGTDIGRQLDLYPFWHSSQRSDPGLNVALYTNITTDALLEDIRTERDPETRKDLVQRISQEIITDTPAIFLYNPALIYIVANSVTSPPAKNINRPSERFASLENWYIEEETMWPIFAD